MISDSHSKRKERWKEGQTAKREERKERKRRLLITKSLPVTHLLEVEKNIDFSSAAAPTWNVDCFCFLSGVDLDCFIYFFVSILNFNFVFRCRPLQGKKHSVNPSCLATPDLYLYETQKLFMRHVPLCEDFSVVSKVRRCLPCIAQRTISLMEALPSSVFLNGSTGSILSADWERCNIALVNRKPALWTLIYWRGGLHPRLRSFCLQSDTSSPGFQKLNLVRECILVRLQQDCRF